MKRGIEIRKKFFYFAIFFFSICFGMISNLEQAYTISLENRIEGLDNAPSMDLIEHDPILIHSNSEFHGYNFDGSGTENDPYRIENLRIDSYGEYSSGIEVRNTNVFFIIQNCYIITDYIGILLSNVASGSSRIIENTCISRTGDGGGIGLSDMSNSIIISNNCSNFMQGLHLNHADSCTIFNNILENNNYQGINIRYSSSNIITYNMVINNYEHGVVIVGNGRNNIIHHNTFINNSQSETYRIDGVQKGTPISQGYDEGYNNIWYDEEEKYGNFWSDYSGIGDYKIDGSAGTADKYPQPPSESAVILLFIPLIILFSVVAFIGIVVIIIFMLKKRA